MRWSLKTLLRSFQRARTRGIRSRKNQFRPGLEVLEVRINPSNVDVLTWHNDNTLSGLNNQETVLNPSNVNASSFGKLFSYALDGYVYAQPLYKADLAIAGGTHNVAFVATEHDSVYALDTDTKAAPYWHTSLILPRAGFTVTTVPSGDTGSGDIVPEVGITGTPLIDAARNTLYVLAKTKEVENATNTPHYVQRLYALNLATGAIQDSVVVGDTTGNGDTNVADNSTNIIVTGANTGRPGDTTGPTGPGAQNGEFRFNAFRENQRGAIVEAPPDPVHPNGLLYLDFASHGDNGNYRGWVIGYDPTNLSLQQQFLTTLDDRAVGIWQSGAPVVVEARPDGFNDLFFSTGNGFGVTAGQVGGRNLTESVARIGTDGNPASPTYGQLIYEDSFTPFNWAALDSGDTDLGSGGTMALPDSAGSPQHPHLLVETGKQGRIYLLDRDMLGGLHPDLATEQAAVVQEVDTQITGVWGSPAYFNGRIYYHGSGDVLVSLPIANAHIDTSGIQRSSFRYNFPGAQPSISADGTSNGIVWELQTDNYNDTSAHEVLRAFDAGNLQTLLYASDQSGARDRLSNSVKFVVPTITNGHVLVGSAGEFSVFGLFPAPDTQVPDAPTNLAAVANSQSQITLTWDPVALTGGGEARQIDVERSTDGMNFMQVAVVSRDATSYVDTGLASGTHYFYRIRAENTLGASDYSNGADATTLLAPTVVSVLNILNTEVDLVWTLVPTADLGYTVQRSTDGGQTWQTAGSVSAGGTFFADTGLNHQPYQYRVLANASSGQTSTSNVVTADLSLGATGVDFSNGFNNATGLTFNGSTARVVDPGWAQLTDGSQNETSTIFTTSRVGISTFQTSFTYRMHDGTDPRSDGMTFIIQGNSPTAIDSAGGGGGLAYGSDSPTGPLGILNSIAIKFDLFNNAGEGTNSTGLFTGGRSPTVRQPGLSPNFPDISIDLNAAPYLDASGNPIININDQHLKRVDLSYDGTTLTETITDLQADPLPDGSQPSVTIRYTVDIPALVGSNTAFVGFGGATGGTTVVQEIRTWTYTGTSSRVATPTNLTATPRTYSNTGFVKLTWSELSPVVTGFQLERSTDQTNWTRLNGGADLPFNDTAYIDTPPQPGTYYYRVRAVSDQGTSNYATSGPVAVLVPVAPSGLVAQQATPTQINLHWVNNDLSMSATAIRVERSDGDASHFVTVATLDPSATSYTDTAVTAPNTYFYRVVATNDNGDSLPTSVASVHLQFVVEPVGYWQFDEASGTVAADASGNGNTGTVVGLADGTIEHVAGRFGNALHFEDHLPDGTVLQTGDARLPVVTVPDSPSLNPTNAITLEAWINADTWGGTTSNNHRILQKGLGDNQYRLTDENGVMKFDLFINGSLRDVQTDLPSTGVWHHVVGTYDGTMMKLYIDGVLKAQLAISGPIAVTTDPLRIGSKDVGGTAGNHFVGTLDEVRIYDRALTEDEIAFQQTWVDQDIGNLSPTGSVAVSGGVYTVRAAGAGIGGTADEFHYMYQPLHGDGSITARVVSIDGRDPLTEAGLMIRETLGTDSRNVALGLTPSGLDLQYRADTGGDTTTAASDPAATAPYWIRLVRQGNDFTAFESADGVNWVQVGTPVTVNMASDVYIGLALTGHNAGHSDSELAAAVFDNVLFS